jgi:DNA polymerase III subunit epsilon
MAFYVRKTLRAGPFRVSLSSSGLGVSAGIPGFRVGAGPRGNYIRVGAGGVYYRSTVGTSRRQTPAAQAGLLNAPPPIGSDIVMRDVTGADAVMLQPTGPGDLVAQLNAAARRPLLWPWTAGAVLIMAAIASNQPIAVALILLLGAAGVTWLAIWQRPKRTVLAFYEVTDQTEAWFDYLVHGFPTLTELDGAWRIEASGNVATTYQHKVNAGASALVRRSRVAFSLKPPRLLTTNIAVPTVTCGRDALLFLPDRVLVRSGRRWSDVAWPTLRIDAFAQRFIEDGRIPRDGTQVDTTWQYVNVRGGPDRRFKNNRQLPVMLYGRLQLSSPTGLRWTIDCSRAAVAEWAASVLRSAR